MLTLFACLVSAWAGPVADDSLLVVDLVDNTTPSQVAEVMATAGLEELNLVATESADEGLYRGFSTDPGASLAVLENHPLVEAAEPIIMFEVQGFRVDSDKSPVVDDPDFKKQWHMEASDFSYVWNHTEKGKGILVAVLDTGFSLTKDFDKAHVAFDKAKSFTGERLDDAHGHGSHCAGSIAQQTNNGFAVAGLASEATILPVKVLSDMGFGSSDWIAAGIDYATEQGADVISMSLGSSQESKVISRAIDRAIEAGVVVVAAAGNDGGRYPGYPGSYDPVINIGSLGPHGARAPYSNYGHNLDLMATGGDKRIAGGGVFQWIKYQGRESLQEWQGTSMATPHAAAAVAILLAEGACENVHEKQFCIEGMLTKTATPAPEGRDPAEYGKGIINLEEAVKSFKQEAITSVEQDNKSGLPWENPAGKLTLGVAALSVLILLGLNKVSNFSKYFLTVSLVTAVASSGPLWLLNYLPWNLHGLAVFMVPWLEIPDFIIGPGTSGCPLWLSALPLLVPFITMTPFHKTRPFVVGAMVSTLSYLVLDAGVGFNPTWWLTTFGSAAWLGANALVLASLTFIATEFESRGN